jgi:homoprotocatechuate degradation regulator HpaR
MPGMNRRALRSFERSLPMALLRAREAVMKRFLPALREHNLSAQQWRVIRALQDADGSDITELAGRCYLLGPSLSRILQNLERRKLIRRQQARDDNRRSLIYLTDAGNALFQAVAPHSAQRYEDITDKFGYGKLELLYELLEELVEKLDVGDDAQQGDEKQGDQAA